MSYTLYFSTKNQKIVFAMTAGTCSFPLVTISNPRKCSKILGDYRPKNLNTA